MTNHGPETSDNTFDLLELDLDKAPNKAAPKVAPTPTATKPVEPSPLDKGKGLVNDCKTFPDLQQLAKRLNDDKTPAGAWFKTQPAATQEQIRLYWRDKRDEYTRQADIATTPVAPIAASETSSIVDALTNVASEGAGNAAVQGAGSLAGGQLRGVGFSTADGYVTALANGVKAATAESYKSTLRSQFHYTAAQLAALTVTIIPEVALPVGTGITHTPTVDTSQMSGAQLKQLWKQTPAQSDAEAKAKAEHEEQTREQERILIAGLVATREGLCISPGEAQKGFKISASMFRAALGETFGHLAPRIRTSKAQFGEVLRGMRTNGLLVYSAVKAATTTDWPADVVSRYCIGRLDTSTNLDTMGPKALVADLVRVTLDAAGNKLAKPYYEIRFTGGEPDVRERVVAEFTRRTNDELLTTTYLGQWLKNEVLRKEYHAIKWGGFWFVPGTDEHTAQLVELLELLVEGPDGKSLIGRDVGVGSTTTNSRWSRGISRTLIAEFTRIAKTFEKNTTDAADRARRDAAEEGLDDAGQELAARRAKCSAEAAHSRLKELQKHTTLVEGYRALLGDEYDGLMTQIKTLRAAVEDCMDSTSLMAANIEIDDDDDDDAAPTAIDHETSDQIDLDLD